MVSYEAFFLAFFHLVNGGGSSFCLTRLDGIKKQLIETGKDSLAVTVLEPLLLACNTGTRAGPSSRIVKIHTWYLAHVRILFCFLTTTMGSGPWAPGLCLKITCRVHMLGFEIMDG